MASFPLVTYFRIMFRLGRLSISEDQCRSPHLAKPLAKPLADQGSRIRPQFVYWLSLAWARHFSYAPDVLYELELFGGFLWLAF